MLVCDFFLFLFCILIAQFIYLFIKKKNNAAGSQQQRMP